MTDHVQDKQDQNAMIAAWQEQVAPLAGFAEAASHILGSIEGPLGELYHQAHSTGDEATEQRVMAVWNESQQLANLIPPFVAALQGGAATIEELKHQRDAIAEELKDLVEAVQSTDADHPLVGDLIELVEEMTEESVWDYISYSGETTTYDEVYDQIYDEIAETFKVSIPAAISLLAALRGDPEELDEYRRELIQHLLKSFEEESHDRQR